MGRSTCLPPRFDNPGYGPDIHPQFFYRVIYVYACTLSLSFYCYSCSVIVIMHVTIVLLMAVLSQFGY